MWEVQADVEKRKASDSDRFAWNKGDVRIFKSVDDMRAKLAAEGKEFVPVSKMKKKKTK